MHKRIEAILVCIFLIVSSLIIAYPINAINVSGNTLYVGGSGPGNYTKIQDAIDNASYGDTVFVYNGTYNELWLFPECSYIYIDKSINLVGENKDTTIINCPDSGVSGQFGIRIGQDPLIVSEVFISGFTLAGDDVLGSIGIYPQFYCSNITIEDCIIYNFGDGMQFVEGCRNITIRNCIAYDNIRRGGISFAWDDVRDFEISGCTIYSNTYGINIHGGKNGLIYHNNLFNNGINAFDESGNNWDKGYPLGGNYWDDYTGVDNYHGSNQDIPGSDGIGDTPYNISGGSNQDNYPFMEQNGWLNYPPNTPTYLHPSNHQKNVNVNDSLLWTCSDPDGDTLTYDVYFGTKSNPPLVSKDRIHKYYTPEDMNYNTTYYWRIVAEDEHDAKTEGPVWDFTTSSEPNNPPNKPSNPYPENGSINIATDVFLNWTGGDPDIGDTVTYDVYFGSMLPLQKIANNISNTSINPGVLINGLTYFWSIVSWDNHGLLAKGPGWHFTTVNPDNKPPDKPIKPWGERSGEIGQNYTYITNTTDPDGDYVYYMWDWGDETYSSWLGPYDSGLVKGASHAWAIKGTYSIHVKAKDVYGAESEWSEPFVVRMPKTYNYNPIIQPFVIYFLFGQIENWEINESHDEAGNWTKVIFDCINLNFICFGHIDKFPWWIFLIKTNINERFTIPYLNDTLKFIGTFEDDFVCGFIIARPKI